MAGRHDEMDMIGHQTVAVHNQLETPCCLRQNSQKQPPVVIYEKDVLAVVAPLRNVMDTTCYDYP